MLFTADCILCNYKASLSAIRELTSDEESVRGLIADIMAIPAMRGLDWNLTSPEVFELAFRKIMATLDNTDPFKSMKARQNEKGMQLYAWLKSLVNESDDPLSMALNLAIIGNSLDLLWSEGCVNVEPIIRDRLGTPVPADNVLALTERLQSSELVVYLGDNAGEVVFDKLLIETMKSRIDAEIIFVVRSVPILNDVTLEDAYIAGIHEVATVMENGIDGPVPGTIVARCSEEVRNLIHRADIIISKGGGNFDSMEEEKDLLYKICFMLMCKCKPYHDYFNTDLYYPILSKCSA